MIAASVAFQLQRHDQNAASTGTTLADKQISASVEFCSFSRVLHAEWGLTYIQHFRSLFVCLIEGSFAFAGHEWFIHILNEGFVRLDWFLIGKQQKPAFV